MNNFDNRRNPQFNEWRGHKKEGYDRRSQVNNPDAKPKAFSPREQKMLQDEKDKAAQAKEVIFQVVTTLRKKHPEANTRKIATLAKAELPRWIYSYLPLLVVLSLILTACGAQPGATTETASPGNNNDPQTSEQTGLPSEPETEEAGEQATEEAPTEEVNQFPISYSPAEDNPYVQISQEQNENQEEGAAFMDAIGENGLGLISTGSNNLYRNNYNIFYAFNDKEGENSDQAIFNLTQKDSSGKETYLYATLEGGIACAKNLNPSFDATGTHLSFDANNGIIATLLDGDNKAICGLELTSRQWKPLDADGNLINPSGEVIATPTSINDPNRDKSPVLTSDPEVIKTIGDKIIAGENINVEKMTDEQKKGLSIYIVDQLNESRGINPIIYNNAESDSKPEQQAEQMYVPTYVDRDGYRWVMNNESEWIKILNSKGIQWEIVDGITEANALVDWPTGELSIISSGEFKGLSIPEYILTKKESGLMIPVIMLDKSLSRMYLGEGGSSVPSQETLVVVNDLVSRKIIVTGIGWFFKEGSSEEIGVPGYLNEETEAFEQINDGGVVYYLFLEENQKKAFQNRYVNRGITEVTSGYSGLVPSSETIDVLSGTKQDHRFIWIDGIGMMEANN